MEEIHIIIKLHTDSDDVKRKLLPEIKEIDNACSHLMNIVQTTSFDLETRHLAAIQLRFYMEKHSSARDDSKSYLKMQILESIAHIEMRTRDVLFDILKLFAESSLRDRNCDPLNDIMVPLTSKDPAILLGGYFHLRAFATVQFPNPYNSFMILISTMESHMKMYLDDPSEIGSEIRRNILEIMSDFFNDFRFEGEISEELLVFWIDVIACVISKRESDDDVDMNVIKAQSQLAALNLLNIFLNRRHMVMITRDRDQKDNFWTEKGYGEQIFLSLMRLCKQYNEVQNVSTDVVNLTIQTIKGLILDFRFREILDMHLTNLIKTVIFPFPATADRYYCSDLLTHIISTKNDASFYGFLISVLNSNDTSEMQKASAIYMMGDIIYLLLDDNHIRETDMEYFVCRYTIPVSRFDKERRIAIYYFISSIIRSKTLNIEMTLYLLDQLLLSIVNDSDFSARTAAFQALNSFIIYKKNSLQEILNDQMDLISMQLIDFMVKFHSVPSYSLVSEMITTFSSDQPSVVIDFINQLGNVYCSKLLSGDHQNDCYHINDIYKRIYYQIKTEPEVLVALQGSIYDIVVFAAKQNITLQMLNIIDMVSVFTKDALIINAVRHLNVIKQVIDKDKDQIFRLVFSFLDQSDDSKSNKLIDLSTLNLAYEICLKLANLSSRNEESEVNSILFLQMILFQHGSSMDDHIPYFINAVVSKMARKIKKCLRHSCVCVIIAALNNNRDLTLTLLTSKKWPGTDLSVFDKFIELLCDDSGKNYNYSRMYVMGLTLVLSLADKNRPDSVDLMNKVLIQALFKNADGLYSISRCSYGSLIQCSSSEDE